MSACPARRVAIAASGSSRTDRRPERLDPLLPAMDLLEHLDARPARADDVPEHGTRLDRGELPGVADEHQARVGRTASTAAPSA